MSFQQQPQSPRFAPLPPSSQRQSVLLYTSPTSPTMSPQPRRRSSLAASDTMQRLRQSMGGSVRPIELNIAQTTTTTTTTKTSEQETKNNDNNVKHDATRNNNNNNRRPWQKMIIAALGQIPAIVLIGLFHLMIGIPFGVSYFPISWSINDNDGGDQIDNDNSSTFPLPGKEALGIRMFLFATMVGQVVMTFTSQFPNPIGLQMVENVPFCHALAIIAMKHCGYGIEAVSTLLILFAIGTILVGCIFWILGYFHWGRIVYYFPTHVLIGCIGGIGIFLSKTGVEVATNTTFDGDWTIFTDDRVWLIAGLEGLLRILQYFTKNGQGEPKLPLLPPVYFCAIPPMFYLVLWIFKIPFQTVEDAGYMFPSLQDTASNDNGDTTMTATSVIFAHLWDMWTVLDFSTFSYAALWEAIPTLIALTLFSLIHVPINIPAFAISTKTEVDMNNELIAHGYSNLLAGCFGGLQNYMAYTQSVLYHKSGGIGKPSGIAVVVVTAGLFLWGPAIASHIPRCMAGTLLLHVGIDLFLESVYDTLGTLDWLEYGGIWLIVIVMTLYGMDAAMIAGAFSAVSTYAVQSMTYLDPVRGTMSAVTLRSSKRNRNVVAFDILSQRRNQILVVQLQGHLFFGTTAQLTEHLQNLLMDATKNIQIVILDFSLVLGIDSSAAQAILKLQRSFQPKYNVDLAIYVTGSAEGFPTAFQLTKELSIKPSQLSNHLQGPTTKQQQSSLQEATEETNLLQALEDATTEMKNITAKYKGSHVCHDLDTALIYAEDALLAMEDPTLLEDVTQNHHHVSLFNNYNPTDENLQQEQELCMQYLRSQCSDSQVSNEDLQILLNLFERQVYQENDVLWKQGSQSNLDAKLLIHGTLLAMLEEEAGTSETVPSGNMIGELSLVQGDARMSSVICISPRAICYALHRDKYETLIRTHPHAARVMDLLCIKSLAMRVQHVSNRIFETRCLPI